MYVNCLPVYIAGKLLLPHVLKNSTYVQLCNANNKQKLYYFFYYALCYEELYPNEKVGHLHENRSCDLLLCAGYMMFSAHMHRLQVIDYDYLVELYLTDTYNKAAFREKASDNRAELCSKIAKYWVEQQEKKPKAFDEVEALKDAVKGALAPSNSPSQSAPVDVSRCCVSRCCSMQLPPHGFAPT